MFFSFDGIDGAGKTTQIQLFSDWLRNGGHDVVIYRDPGSTELSEKIRDILLDTSGIPISSTAEMMLYMAARTQLVAEKIEPDLAAGKIVIADRYILATIAYQGYGGDVPIDDIRSVGKVATSGKYPDLTFVLDVNPNISEHRRQREPDRMEQRGKQYMARVRRGFLTEAANHPDSIVVVDGNQTIAEVQSGIRKAARPRLAKLGGTA